MTTCFIVSVVHLTVYHIYNVICKFKVYKILPKMKTGKKGNTLERETLQQILEEIPSYLDIVLMLDHLIEFASGFILRLRQRHTSVRVLIVLVEFILQAK